MTATGGGLCTKRASRRRGPDGTPPAPAAGDAAGGGAGPVPAGSARAVRAVRRTPVAQRGSPVTVGSGRQLAGQRSCTPARRRLLMIPAASVPQPTACPALDESVLDSLRQYDPDGEQGLLVDLVATFEVEARDRLMSLRAAIALGDGWRRAAGSQPPRHLGPSARRISPISAAGSNWPPATGTTCGTGTSSRWNARAPRCRRPAVVHLSRPRRGAPSSPRRRDGRAGRRPLRARMRRSKETP